VTICDFAKSGHNEDDYKKLQKSGFFVTICDLVYFYTSLAYSTDSLIYIAAEQIIIRSTFDSAQVTKTVTVTHFCQLFTDKSLLKSVTKL
jgi:hypothetical protein